MVHITSSSELQNLFDAHQATYKADTLKALARAAGPMGGSGKIVSSRTSGMRSGCLQSFEEQTKAEIDESGKINTHTSWINLETTYKPFSCTIV